MHSQSGGLYRRDLETVQREIDSDPHDSFTNSGASFPRHVFNR
jgi:hypothetical protein